VVTTGYFRVSSTRAVEAARQRLIQEPYQSPTRILGDANRAHPPRRLSAGQSPGPDHPPHRPLGTTHHTTGRRPSRHATWGPPRN